MRVKVEGLKELERALAELPKTTGKALLRRVLKKAAQPFDAAWRSMAPDDAGTSGDDLKASGGISTKLGKRQKGLHRKMFKTDKASVEMFAGPNDPSAVPLEFGTGERFQRSGKSVGQVSPYPFVRPAWEAEKMNILGVIEDDLGDEIAKTAARLAKKRAKAG